jgi:hypothetical protein
MLWREGSLKRSSNDTYNEAETVQRREATLKRMLATPHRPHAESAKPRKSKAKKTKSGRSGLKSA